MLLDMLKACRLLESWNIPIQMLQPPMDIRVPISDCLDVGFEQLLFQVNNGIELVQMEM
jgi:hypothetical protein